MDKHVVIHGHFYQPPRENPWLEEVELQDSAYPYHDWNSRITAECYAPNSASRILDQDRRIIDIVSNYSSISFNFGPTLLSWMARREPEIYSAIIEADRKSRETFGGHGSSLAQAYNHLIMPLANSRDKRTQIIWGLQDFESRFERKPEGMWLPETAVDLETLEIMAEKGFAFAILAPHQAGKIRTIGTKEWTDVSGGHVDPKLTYSCKLPSGKAIALFFYDGPISQDIAFGNLLDSGENLANRILSAFAEENGGAQLSHVATDGETYGHHHRFGDMALAYCLHFLKTEQTADLTVYGQYLESHPPEHEVEIIENTSWSCVHGIERWRANCGCSTGMHPGWNQEWRAPLRGAMDWLRDNLAQIYEEQLGPIIKDPWKARDEYVTLILDRSEENVDRFLREHAGRDLTPQEQVKVLKLLEMQRHAMLMYTSCGWFFDEISGIETVQVIQYAARAMQLANDVSGIALEEAYVGLLERAPSNIPEFNNGADIYRTYVKPTVLDLIRVAVHYGVSSLFREYSDTAYLYTYTLNGKKHDRLEVGRQKLGIGTVSVRSNITREEMTVTYAVLHLGDHNIVGGARVFSGDDTYGEMYDEISQSFKRSDISEVIRLIDKHYSDHSYSLWHLFRDEQRTIMNRLLNESLNEIEISLRQIYDRLYPVMQAIEGVRMALPKHYTMVLEFVLNTDARAAIESDDLDIDNIKKVVTEVKRWPIAVDKTTLNFVASRRIETMVRQWSEKLDDVTILEQTVQLMDAIAELELDLDLWMAQTQCFQILRQQYPEIKQKAESGDAASERWAAMFESLARHLMVKIE